MAEDQRNPQDGRPSGGGNGLPPKPPMRMTRGAFSWLIILGVAMMLLVMVNQSMSRNTEIKIDEFWRYVQNGVVKELLIREDMIVGEVTENQPTLPAGGKFEVRYPGIAQNFDKFEEKLDRMAVKNRPKYRYQPSNNLVINIALSLIPWIVLFAIAYFFIFRQFRQAGAGAGMLGNFGRSRHRMSTKEHTNVTFSDVAGIEEAKDEVLEIVEFLRNPKRFQRLGGRIPRGVLLVGEPGCGKTLLAKAIAGEAEVPFFSISGSDFVEMFVGVGASRVRDLFRQAKENSPCIIFLDEIDAVGRRRGVGYNGGGHDEREQTLNAILVEMDGFESDDQVIVIAATNRADVLDPALVRPGRFDRQVFVPLPDVKGRFEILKVHAKKIKLQPPVETKLQRLARATPMFSGADLAAVINESALLATLSGKDAVEMEDLEESRDKVRWGRAKRSRVVEEKDRVLTAYHEAGHALVQSLLKDADPVHKVSIIPRGPYGGVTFSLPEKDRTAYSRSYLDATLRVLCAGRLAEELLGEDINSGASGDIKQVTTMARYMVTEWGMSDRLGFVYYGDEPTTRNRAAEIGLSKEFSDKTSEVIDEEVRRIVDAAYVDTRRLIDGHRERLEAIAQALLKYETLDGDEVRRLIAGEVLDKPTVADLIAAEQDRRRLDSPPVARPVKHPPEEDAGPIPSPA
ncbi:ATP-dependent zinc metalloprotease FtsH [Phycisphaerae bacterium RAS1]|nr:ATP-dependent zinc metalloprotease FtsH [Phycisphaerae bacterium RAS1]